MRQIKVGMDISQTAHMGGVSIYTENLAERLSNNPSLDMLFFYSSLRKRYKGPLKNVKKYRLPPTLFELLFNKIRNVGIERFIGPVDIFHSSDWIQPPSKAKKVTTFHDVVPIKYPEWSHPKIVEVHKRRLKIVEREIDFIIAVSQSTKKDLLEVSNIDPDKVLVIYEGVEKEFKPYPKEEVERFRAKMNLPKDFVLAIGGIGDRRNLKRVKDVTKGYPLIITGETIPHVNHQDFPLLYCASKLLLYPSFYEGFGLPILEAMACGVPVITSNISSMPEVGGDAAIYVKPEDVEDITKKFKMVVEDKDLRKEMISKGFEQAKKFTWEKCARETAELYRRLVNRE